MSAHRNDKTIDELKVHFNAVLDWASAVFTMVLPEMRGLEWGRLYETYHKTSYNPGEIAAAVEKLAADEYVTNRKGIFEFLLGGSTDKKLLAVWVFDAKVKKVAYNKQTQKAQAKKTESNCPLSAPLVRTPTKPESISLTKWMPTMSPHGVKAAIVQPRTAKYSALRTIVLRAIDSMAAMGRAVRNTQQTNSVNWDQSESTFGHWLRASW